MTPDDLMAACEEVSRRVPNAELVRNQVGNLAILTTLEHIPYCIGWIDLSTSEVEWVQ